MKQRTESMSGVRRFPGSWRIQGNDQGEGKGCIIISLKNDGGGGER